MKLVRMLALRDHEWAGKPRKRGEVYEADSHDDRFGALQALGLAKIVDPEPEPTPKGKYQRRDMRASEG